MSEAEMSKGTIDYERWMRIYPVWPLQLGCELLAGVEPSAGSRRLLDAYGGGELGDAPAVVAPSDPEAKRIWDIALRHIEIKKLLVTTEELAEGTIHWVFQYHLLSWASIGAPGLSLSQEIKLARDEFAIADPQSIQLLEAMRSTNEKKERRERMDKIFATKPIPPAPSAMAQKAALAQ